MVHDLLLALKTAERWKEYGQRQIEYYRTHENFTMKEHYEGFALGCACIINDLNKEISKQTEIMLQADEKLRKQKEVIIA